MGTNPEVRQAGPRTRVIVAASNDSSNRGLEILRDDAPFRHGSAPTAAVS